MEWQKEIAWFMCMLSRKFFRHHISPIIPKNTHKIYEWKTVEREFHSRCLHALPYFQPIRCWTLFKPYQNSLSPPSSKKISFQSVCLHSWTETEGSENFCAGCFHKKTLKFQVEWTAVVLKSSANFIGLNPHRTRNNFAWDSKSPLNEIIAELFHSRVRLQVNRGKFPRQMQCKILKKCR